MGTLEELVSNVAIDSDDADTEDRPDCTCDYEDNGHGDDPDCEVHHPPNFYTVAIFMVDRSYGGPEEGGWWYDTGHPLDYIPHGTNPHDLITVFGRDSKKEACAWRATLQAQLDATINQGRRETSSVLSEGRFSAELCIGWPKPFPSERPHYE